MGRDDVEEGQLPEKTKPPDGGWGWIILLGCFVITGFSYGFPKAVSIYFKDLMHDFHVGYSDTAWISSIMLAMLYGTGPLSSIMVNQFGCLLTGERLGMALNFQPSLIMLGSYFDKRRPLANGLAAAGSPVFLSALSPLGQILLENFGWRGGFLIMGGLLLNCCTCGALMRPLAVGTKKRREKVMDTYETKEMLPMGERMDEAGGTLDNVKKPKKLKKKKGKKMKSLLNFSIFKIRGFIIYTIAKFIMVLGLFVPTILLVNYAKDTGIPDKEAAFLLSIIGFIDIFARPSCGMLAGMKRIRPHITYLFSFAMLFNGLTDIFSARANTYTSLVIFCIFFGVSYGMVGALQFEVLMTIVGSQKFSSAIGLNLLIEAVAVLIGPPSAGRLVDALKKYEIIFYLAGSEVVLSALFLAVASYCCLNVKKETPPQLENPSIVRSNSEMEETEADLLETKESLSNDQSLAQSTDSVGSDRGNHTAIHNNGGQPKGENIASVPDGCSIDQVGKSFKSINS
uniref:Solute carrier family 16 member 8 n=1 Tax=Naja naja TaxID=35670 RepID=A0A8C6X7F2_NAJNA